MKTYKYQMACIALAISITCNAQVMYPTNNPTANPVPMGFLGWNDTGNQSLDIRQNNLLRERFNSVPYTTLDNVPYTSACRILYPLEGVDFPPFSMHHLGLKPDEDLKRTWMNVGTTYTDNDDILHIGLCRLPDNTYGGSNHISDAVIVWGDNRSEVGPDNLRFIFIEPQAQGLPGTPTPNSLTDEGQEVGRFTPEGNFGIGNFFTNGIYEQPSHKLDVLGTGRFRDIQENVGDVLITGVERDSLGDYVLHYNPYPGDEDLYLDGTGNWTAAGGADCRWKNTNSITNLGEQDMYMGFDPNSDCYRQNLAIGSNGSKAKLTVDAWALKDKSDVGVYFSMTDNTNGGPPPLNYNTGIVSSLRVDISGYNTDEGLTYIGVDSDALDGKYAVALKGESSSSGGINIGCYAKSVSALANQNIGLYTEATSNPGDYAIQHIGPVVGSQPPIFLSDESIKTEIETIDNASDILNQLQPKKYFNVEPEERNLSLAEGQQYGFLAQEVQEVLPSIVKDVRIVEAKDSTGFIEGTDMELLGIQYSQLISILVAGHQEQSGLITEQQGLIQEQNDLITSLEESIAEQAAQLEALQTQMQDVLTQVQDMQIATNNCCSQKSGTNTETPRSQMNGQEMKLGQNVPNPFTNQTRIDFELPIDAQVILEITDGTGRPIQTLIDGQMSSGVHSTTWDGSGVAPGMYYYTLYANGELLSKKMIKR